MVSQRTGQKLRYYSRYDRISQLEPELMCLICADGQSSAEKMAVFSNARVFEFESPAAKMASCDKQPASNSDTTDAKLLNVANVLV